MSYIKSDHLSLGTVLISFHCISHNILGLQCLGLFVGLLFYCLAFFIVVRGVVFILSFICSQSRRTLGCLQCMVDVCFCVYVSVSSSDMSSQGPSSHHQAWHQMPLSAESSYRPKFFIYDLSHFKIGAFMKFTGKPLSSHLTSRRQCWGVEKYCRESRPTKPVLIAIYAWACSCISFFL